MTPASGQWWYKTLQKFTEQAHKFIFCLVSLLHMFVYCNLYLNLFNQIVQGIVFEFRKMVSKESKLKQLNSFKHLAYKQLGYYKGYFLLGIFYILWRHIWDVCCWDIYIDYPLPLLQPFVRQMKKHCRQSYLTIYEKKCEQKSSCDVRGSQTW